LIIFERKIYIKLIRVSALYAFVYCMSNGHPSSCDPNVVARFIGPSRRRSNSINRVIRTINYFNYPYKKTQRQNVLDKLTLKIVEEAFRPPYGSLPPEADG